MMNRPMSVPSMLISRLAVGRRIRHGLPLIALLALVLGLVPAASADSYDATKVDEQVAAAALKDPKGVLRVIVQAQPGQTLTEKSRGHKAVAALLREKDDGDTGKVKASLPLVNGMTAELTGKRILKLSRHPAIKRISGDYPVRMAADTSTLGTTVGDTTDALLRSMQTLASQAPTVWTTRGVQGQGVTVAVLDSGVRASADLPGAVHGIDTATGTTALSDGGGHGTHVAGIVAGTGAQLSGKYKGIAPQVRVLSVKVTNDTGMATYGSIIKGLQWVVANRNVHNIRVVNMSLGATPRGSYRDDPLVAAAEMAWFSGITVVTSAGNEGNAPGTITVPGVDPYVIAVGAFYDKGTPALSDDSIPAWSSRGPTAYDNLIKPDILASGHRVISLRTPGSYLDTQLGNSRVVETNYFRLSGTSMAAPVVAGAAALVLAANPTLTPNQVKYVLTQTAKPYTGVARTTQGAGAVDAAAAVTMAVTGVVGQANLHQRPSNVFARSIHSLAVGAPLVWRDPNYLGRTWSSASWDTVSWDSASWDNLSWESINWAMANWTSVSWESLTGWSSGSWNSGSWDSGSWDSGSWDSGSWDSGAWDSGQWDSFVADDAE